MPLRAAEGAFQGYPQIAVIRGSYPRPNTTTLK